MEALNLLKEALKDEEHLDGASSHKSIEVIPILHNENLIILQFCGWAIHLNADGTYWHEIDCTGG